MKEFNRKRYEVILGSDVINDGVFLELNDTSQEKSETVLFVFRSDDDGRYSFSAYRDGVPLGLVEEFIREARRRLPPSLTNTTLDKHCCERMNEIISFQCEMHSHPFECPDHLIHYSAKSNEYGLVIHDGGSSYVSISFCPWCGDRLPKGNPGSKEEDVG
jgi:hypothetical protein